MGETGKQYGYAMSHSSDDPRYFGNVLAQRLTRRSVLQDALSAVPALAAAGLLPFDVTSAAVAPGGGLTFNAIKGSKDMRALMVTRMASRGGGLLERHRLT